MVMPYAVPTKDTNMVTSKFTIYMNEDDRDEIERLRAALIPIIADLPNRSEYLNKKDELSTTALFRYLRHQEMKRLGLMK